MSWKPIAIAATAAALSTSSQAQWSHQGCQLVPAQAGPRDHLGATVATDGVRVIAGSPQHQIGRGRVDVFDLGTGERISSAMPASHDYWQYFGSAVAIDGPFAVVGALGDDSSGSYAGRAYVISTTTGDVLRVLEPDDAGPQVRFGNSVAIEGTLAVVGALGSGTSGQLPGSAYVFDVTTGNQLAKLTAADASAADGFGASVSLDGGLLLVGAWADDDNGSQSGSAYVFDLASGTEVRKLLPADGAAGDAFGVWAALDGTTAILASPYDDGWGAIGGSAYLFDVGSGLEIAKLTPPGGSTSIGFAWSVAIDGGLAAVGAMTDPVHGVDSGSVYLFDAGTGTQLGRLTNAHDVGGERLGSSVAIAGQVIASGAELNSTITTFCGAVYLFRPEHIGQNYCSTNANSTGYQARMFTWGSPSLAEDRLTLVASPIPITQYLFFHGPAQIQVPFGNGSLCVGGGLVRADQVRLAQGGAAVLPTGPSAVGIHVVGTRHFQCWFRDPQGGGASFNSSDGISVTFLP